MFIYIYIYIYIYIIYIYNIYISKKLDEATVELKKMGKLLAEEKRKTDELLFQMLPVKVANQLRDGKKVEAGK